MSCEKCSNRNKRNICKICHEGDCYEEIPITNYERIIRMDIVDLAKFIGAIKCNTFQIECGYPNCKSMNGDYCVAMRKDADKDILCWLLDKSKEIMQ